MTEKHSFFVSPITCHAWNKDRTQIALSPNNHEVHIYQRNGNDWILLDVLNQHDLRVTGIDWAPNSNRIVTCSADRNAYVWTLSEDGKWKPTLVLLRIIRAATCVKWSPKENKFAVGSGAKLISVCYFEGENDWWVSKHIKKPIKSTVTALDWHPNNFLLVVGSTDFKVRVYSAYVKDIDESPPATPWGKTAAIGQLLAEFQNSSFGGGWIHSVSFSGCGTRVSWVSHDASICVADASRNNAVSKLRTEYLPFLSCVWVSSNAIVVAGHGCCPMIYVVDDSGHVYFGGKLDTSTKKETGGLRKVLQGATSIKVDATLSGEQLSLLATYQSPSSDLELFINDLQSYLDNRCNAGTGHTGCAMKKFQSFDRNARLENVDTVLDTIHQNAITCVCIYQGVKGNATKVSSSGNDGHLVIWDLQSVEGGMQGLKIA